MSDELALITPATQNKYLFFILFRIQTISSVGSAESKNVYKDNNTVLIFSLCISPADIIIILLLSKVASQIYIYIIYTVCVCLPRSRSSHFFFFFIRTHALVFFSFLNVQQTGWPLYRFLIFRHINICCAYNDGLICFLLSSRICKCLVCLFGFFFFLSG
jgi:hypothetical protein